MFPERPIERIPIIQTTEEANRIIINKIKLKTVRKMTIIKSDKTQRVIYGYDRILAYLTAAEGE